MKLFFGTYAVAFLTIVFALAVHADVTVTALDASSRVLSVGDSAELQLRLYNAVPSPLDGTLSVALTDFQGRIAGTVVKPVSVNASGCHWNRM